MSIPTPKINANKAKGKSKMNPINTSYKTNLNYWEACLLERLTGMIHAILLNQLETPSDAHDQIIEIGMMVEEFMAQFNEDIFADDKLMNEQEEAICG